MDVARWVDQQRIGRLQVLVFVISGAATLLDGFDAQAIGYVAPAIVKDWHVSPVSMSGVFSSGTFGILLGCLLVAPLADWLGRRWLIILSLAEFGLATAATAFAPSLAALMALRFVTGIGLGACMSNTVALTSEYVPSRLRARTTTWMFCGYPLGAFLGGLFVAGATTAYGWRPVFLAGGAVPLLLAALAAACLPESLYHLASRPHQASRIAAIVKRFGPGAVLPADGLTNADRQPGLTVSHLLRDGRAYGTALLWIMFFLMLVEVFLLTSWTPILLNASGQSLTVSVLTMAMIQGGGVVALLACGPLFDRLGFFVILVPLLVASAVAVASMGGTGGSPSLIMTFAFVAGAGVMGGQSSLIVLAALFYPSFIRSTGVGWALGIGRFGAVVGPLLGGFLLSLHWKTGAIFLVAAGPPLLTAACLLLMREVPFSQRRSRLAEPILDA